MKKYLILLILTFIFMVGCGDNEIKAIKNNVKILTCTRIQKEENMDKDTAIRMTFTNDIIQNANIVIKVAIHEEYLKDHPVDSIGKSLTEETTKEGLIVNMKARGNVISIVMDMDLEKLDDKTKAKYNLNISDYKKLKSTYERNGYSCE